MMESKTIKKWFNDFPEPYRKQALAEAKRTGTLKCEKDNAVIALASSFQWCASKQGHDYWSAFCKTLDNYRDEFDKI